jgi:L-fuculose-phosphate aldolase
VLLEWLCALHLRASALGAPRVLTEDQQLAVIEQALARGYGSTRPAGGDQ